MVARTIEFSADQVRDFNTRAQDQIGDGSLTIRANNNVPSRLLDGDTSKVNPTHSGSLGADKITNYRATFQVDSDNEVVPGSVVGIQFSVDGGLTWRNFYDESNLAEDGYGEYQVFLDGGTNANGPDASDEWIAIVATSPTDTDGTGFMMSDNPISPGDLFNTFDVMNSDSEFTVPKGVVCFTNGTRIRAEQGDVPVEELAVGDLVWTKQNGLRPILWLKSRDIETAALKKDTSLRPIKIAAGSLGSNLPKRDLIVSQQHRVMVEGKIAERMFGSAQVLIAAKFLLDIDGVEIVTADKPFSYIHFACENHEIVLVEGAHSETLYLGDQAVHAFTEQEQDELFKIFYSDEKKCAGIQYEIHQPAMPFVKRKKAENLIKRHKKNGMPFVNA